MSRPFMPKRLGGTAGLTGLAYVTTFKDSSRSTGALALPGGLLAGDIVIICDRRSFNSSQNQTDPPSTYSSLYRVYNSGRTACYSFSYRILDGTETEIPAYSGAGFLGSRRNCFVYRPAGLLSGVAVLGAGAERTDGNPSAITVPCSASASFTIAVAQYGCDGSGGAINPRTFTGATPDAESTIQVYNYAKAAGQAAPASNVTVDMDDEGNGNQIVGFYIELT